MASKIDWKGLSDDEVKTLVGSLKTGGGPAAPSLANEGHKELVRRGLFREHATDIADAIVLKDQHAEINMARAIELLKGKGRLEATRPLDAVAYMRLQQEIQESVQRVHGATTFRLHGFKIPREQRVDSPGPDVVVS